MSGRKKIDMLTEQVERLERAQRADPLDAWLRTVATDDLDRIERAIVTNPEPLARRLASGESAVAVLKGILA